MDTATKAQRPTPAQSQAFLNREPIPGVTLQHNDYVKVVAGQYAGKSGSLVSVEQLGDDPIYLVELDWSDGDALIAQSQLQFVAHD
jgi:hypothetical protein